MERSNDPAHVRVGINLGSAEEGMCTARLVTTFTEVLARTLNLVRLGIVAAPVLVQCFYIHTVDFGSWIMRLAAVYMLILIACFFTVPEQLYSGMGLKSFRWAFEWFYPDISQWNSVDSKRELQPGILGGLPANKISGAYVRLRLHDTNKYLFITREGWGAMSDEASASRFLLQQAYAKDGKPIPDTYNFRVVSAGSEWHLAWLSFQPINHLRFGGWLGAYRDSQKMCPYKLIQDSSCPPGTCKLLCAWPGMPSPTHRNCTGFYLAERLCGNERYVGHGPDREAVTLELVAESQ